MITDGKEWLHMTIHGDFLLPCDFPLFPCIAFSSQLTLRITLAYNNYIVLVIIIILAYNSDTFIACGTIGIISYIGKRGPNLHCDT